MKYLIAILILALSVGCASPPYPPAQSNILTATGEVVRHANFPAREVLDRNIDIWLPPSYRADVNKRYPVVYVQDGNVIFDPALSQFTGQDWDIDTAMTEMIAAGDIREAIIVGIWSSDQRYEDYMPEKAVHPLTPAMRERLAERPREFDMANMQADKYLAFMVKELKPFIDLTYRTLPNRENTTVMGASMGGLISTYAAIEYPDVFSASAGLSSHVGSARGAAVEWFVANPPDPAQTRLYFDYGDQGVDGEWQYPKYHAELDTGLKVAGYARGLDYVNQFYPGTGHGEQYWAARVKTPLKFLIGAPDEIN